MATQSKADKAAAEAKRRAAYEQRRAVGDQIEALMASGGCTAEQIAERVGCTIKRIQSHLRWANGGKQPRFQLNAGNQFILVGKPLATRERATVTPQPEPAKKPARKRAKKTEAQ